MMGSLQDQLMNAGLVDKDKAKKIASDKNRKKKQQRNKGKKAQPKKPVLKVDHAKLQKDRELNEKLAEAKQQKELAAQIKQLVEPSRIPREQKEGDRPFFFENKGKVKQLYVSEDLHRKISAGSVRIVNYNGVFELVPADVAEKVARRIPALVIELPVKDQSGPEDDPYKDFEVPDDLIW